MDTTPLRDACRSLLDAATEVATRADNPAPPDGEWSADQILAHVSVVTAATIVTAATVAAGANATYDNRHAQDTWTLTRVAERAGGNAGLRERIRAQVDALCTLGGEPGLGEAELDTLVPALLLSNDALMLDQPITLRDILTGLAEAELPGHTKQLLALMPSHVGAQACAT
ncbi:hypothetical protein [Streptomyces sp. NPDC050738]|uniref:hypothetical protein n=1 Tax=Streptomyces sp. NPDC050738 TaxID=3154744 RepID=UPI003415369A